MYLKYNFNPGFIKSFVNVPKYVIRKTFGVAAFGYL